MHQGQNNYYHRTGGLNMVKGCAWQYIPGAGGTGWQLRDTAAAGLQARRGDPLAGEAIQLL